MRRAAAPWPFWSARTAAFAESSMTPSMASGLGAGGLFGGTFWLTSDVFDVPGIFWVLGFGFGAGGGEIATSCFVVSRGGLLVRCCVVSGGVAVPAFGDFIIITATAATATRPPPAPTIRPTGAPFFAAAGAAVGA